MKVEISKPMSYCPKFSYNHALARGLMTIEGARRVVDVLPLLPDADLQLRQQSRQRSTHHSTKIENNQLTEGEVLSVLIHPERQSEQEQEVRNYWRALEWMESKMDDQTPVTERFIRELHAIILPAGPGRPRRMSNYREEEIGVVDSTKRDYEYMAPEPGDVPGLLGDLIKWHGGNDAAELSGPIRAGILAYQFVTIHPFMNGNGRCARALATYELWRSGYWMRGFLSMEEQYTNNLEAYYGNLQMGLPANYYDGRNDPDLTPWLQYFIDTMALASDRTRKSAEMLYSAIATPTPFWNDLSRLQQQLLSRCLTLAIEGASPPDFSPQDVAGWFSVTPRTARNWLEGWKDSHFVIPASGELRVRRWRLAENYEQTVLEAQKRAKRQE